MCRPFHSAFQLLVYLTLPAAALAAESPAESPASQALAQEPDATRVFRFRAVDSAEMLRHVASEADIDEASRDKLLAMIDQHLRAVEQKVERLDKNLPPPQLRERAGELGRDFGERAMAQWAEAHPEAFQSLQQQVSVSEALMVSLAQAPDMVVKAIDALGLPADRNDDARKIVRQAHENLLKFNDEAQQRQQKIESLPPGDDKTLAEEALMADGQTAMIIEARSALSELRKLVAPPQQQELDRQLIGLVGGVMDGGPGLVDEQ